MFRVERTDGASGKGGGEEHRDEEKEGKGDVSDGPGDGSGRRARKPAARCIDREGKLGPTVNTGTGGSRDRQTAIGTVELVVSHSLADGRTNIRPIKWAGKAAGTRGK